MKQLNHFLAAGAVLVMGAISSSAQSTLGPFTTSSPIPSQLTDWTGSLSFPQFNPALGTLDSVTLDLSSSLSSTVTVHNTSGSSYSGGSLGTEMTVSVEDAGNNLIANDPQVEMSIPSYNFSLAPGQGQTSALLSAYQDTGALTYTTPAVLSEFTGNGSFSLSATTTSLTEFDYHGGNTTSSQVTDAGITGTVVYTYTDTPLEVPETSTFGLLIFGLAGVMPLLRRQRLCYKQAPD